MKTLYFEDVEPGFKFSGGPITVSADDITTFAAQFDPQPFHLDPDAAKSSFFNGLAASGWHTAALTMRLLVTNLPFAGEYIGSRIEIHWPRPVRPNDQLRVEAELLEKRASRSLPKFGVFKMKILTLNQHDQVVQELTSFTYHPRRNPES
jgi:acyl dehydratase